MYEFLTTGAFVAVAVFLLVLIRRDLRFLGTFVIGLAIIMLVAASVALLDARWATSCRRCRATG